MQPKTVITLVYYCVAVFNVLIMRSCHEHNKFVCGSWWSTVLVKTTIWNRNQSGQSCHNCDELITPHHHRYRQPPATLFIYHVQLQMTTHSCDCGMCSCVAGDTSILLWYCDTSFWRCWYCRPDNTFWYHDTMEYRNTDLFAFFVCTV